MSEQIRVSVSVLCAQCRALSMGAVTDTKPGSTSHVIDIATERAREAGWKYVHIWQDKQTISGEWRCPKCIGEAEEAQARR